MSTYKKPSNGGKASASVPEWQKITANCKVSIRGIGADEANEILDRDEKWNRHLSNVHVQRLSTKMLNGEWRFNGESIAIDPDGALVDGQHRLRAVAKTDLVLPFVVVEGVDGEGFITYNQGKKRDFAGMLETKGEKNSKELARAVSVLASYRAGKSLAMEPEQKFETLDQNPTLRDFVEKFIDIVIVDVKPGFLAAVNLVFAEKDEKTADKFFKELLTGEGDNSNVDWLREALNEIAQGDYTDKGSYRQSAFHYAWNATRTGKTLEGKRVTNSIPPIK